MIRAIGRILVRFDLPVLATGVPGSRMLVRRGQQVSHPIKQAEGKF
jgi:predicted nuclease with RNAse H fold